MLFKSKSTIFKDMQTISSQRLRFACMLLHRAYTELYAKYVYIFPLDLKEMMCIVFIMIVPFSYRAYKLTRPEPEGL